MLSLNFRLFTRKENTGLEMLFKFSGDPGRRKQNYLILWGKTDGTVARKGVTISHIQCHEPRSLHCIQFSIHLLIGCTILGLQRLSQVRFTLDQEQFDLQLFLAAAREADQSWKTRLLECILKEFGLVPGHISYSPKAWLLESSIFCRFYSQSYLEFVFLA